MFMPTYAAKKVSPLDNSLFSSFKVNLNEKKHKTLKTFKKHIQETLRGFTSKKIRIQFNHCGYKTIGTK